MGKSLDGNQRWQIRRQVDEIEANEVEVSELEKILSHLAYLLGLLINADDDVRLRLRSTIGIAPETFADLTQDQIEFLTLEAQRLKLPKGARLLFWMWRAWILQKEFEGLAPDEVERVISNEDPEEQGQDLSKRQKLVSPTESRDSFEWLELSENIVQAKGNLIEILHQAESESSKAFRSALYALNSIQGSPLAVVRTARRILLEAAEATFTIDEAIRKIYGFGENHRPNRRFDQFAARNIRAYVWWRHQRGSFDAPLDFMNKKDGSPRTPQQARTAAMKAASRFEEELLTYSQKLETIESNEEIPTLFYCRSIEPSTVEL